MLLSSLLASSESSSAKKKEEAIKTITPNVEVLRKVNFHYLKKLSLKARVWNVNYIQEKVA